MQHRQKNLCCIFLFKIFIGDRRGFLEKEDYMRQFHHLNYQDRCNIQYGLTLGYSYNFIGNYIGVNRSTIMREVKSHLKKLSKGASRNGCKRITCNGCSKLGKCVMKKQFYSASKADYEYKKALVQTRQKHQLAKVDILKINELLVDGIERGLGLYSIMLEDNGNIINISEKTLRKYINDGLFTIKNYHLREKGKRKIKKNKENRSVIRASSKRAKMRFGRLYADFLRFLHKNPDLQVVEFDTVHGTQEENECILTIMFVGLGFQIGLKVKKYDTHDVNKKIRELFSRFSKKTRKKLFAICLADNGDEFDLFPQIEFDENGEQLIHTFFTRPYKSSDKARCERNHRELRKLFPKGKPLAHFTQEQIDEAFSHLNSSTRKVLNGLTPYQMMKNKYGERIISLMNIKKISFKKVRLKPLI